MRQRFKFHPFYRSKHVEVRLHDSNSFPNVTLIEWGAFNSSVPSHFHDQLEVMVFKQLNLVKASFSWMVSRDRKWSGLQTIKLRDPKHVNSLNSITKKEFSHDIPLVTSEKSKLRRSECVMKFLVTFKTRFSFLCSTFKKVGIPNESGYQISYFFPEANFSQCYSNIQRHTNYVRRNEVEVCHPPESSTRGPS